MIKTNIIDTQYIILEFPMFPYKCNINIIIYSNIQALELWSI